MIRSKKKMNQARKLIRKEEEPNQARKLIRREEEPNQVTMAMESEGTLNQARRLKRKKEKLNQARIAKRSEERAKPSYNGDEKGKEGIEQTLHTDSQPSRYRSPVCSPVNLAFDFLRNNYE